MSTAIDPAFSSVGKEVGLDMGEILPVPVPAETYGKFFTGDSYIVKTLIKNARSNTLSYDIHFWLGKKHKMKWAHVLIKPVSLMSFRWICNSFVNARPRV